jgi:hypothetical protein
MGLRTPLLITVTALVGGVLLIPVLAALFHAGVLLAPQALLAAAVVGAVWLVFRRSDARRRDTDAAAPAAKMIRAEGQLLTMPDYPHELPWWDEETGSG